MEIKVGFDYIAQYDEYMEPKIREYEQEEIVTGQIVFYGPSIFTRWGPKYGIKPMAECLLGKSGKRCVINRGFGSSCAEHQLYYYPRMIRPLAPKVLVYECFGNGASLGYTPEECFTLGQRVIAYARHDFPGIHIYLPGPHPRKDESKEPGLLEVRAKVESILKEFVQKTPDCHYIDVINHPLMQSKDIFSDNMHYNAFGYERYTQVYQEALKDELAKY